MFVYVALEECKIAGARVKYVISREYVLATNKSLNKLRKKITRI